MAYRQFSKCVQMFLSFIFVYFFTFCLFVWFDWYRNISSSCAHKNNKKKNTINLCAQIWSPLTAHCEYSLSYKTTKSNLWHWIYRPIRTLWKCILTQRVCALQYGSHFEIFFIKFITHAVAVCVCGDMRDERPPAKTPQHNIKFGIMEIDIDLFIQIFIIFIYILLSFTMRWICKMSLICRWNIISIDCFESTTVSLHFRAVFVFRSNGNRWYYTYQMKTNEQSSDLLCVGSVFLMFQCSMLNNNNI